MHDQPGTPPKNTHSARWRAHQKIPEADQDEPEPMIPQDSPSSSPVSSKTWRDYREESDEARGDLEPQDWRRYQKEPHSQSESESESESDKESLKNWRDVQLSDDERREKTLRLKEKMDLKSAKRKEQMSAAQREWEAGRDARRQGDVIHSKTSTHHPPKQTRFPRTKTSIAPQARSQSEEADGEARAESRGEARRARKKKQEKGKRRRPPIDGRWLRDAGLKYLGRFSASETHFRQVMKRKLKKAESLASDDLSVHATWIDEAVAYAYQFGGLNDARLASQLLKSYTRRGLAQQMIRQKLRQKGISSDEIDAAFQERSAINSPELDQLYAAAKAAQKRRIGPWGPSRIDYPAKQKQLGVLARRGFSYSIAQRVLEASIEEAEEWIFKGESST